MLISIYTKKKITTLIDNIFKFIFPEYNTSEYWLFGISPEGIGVIGMIINFMIAIIISSISKPPPIEVYEIVDN